MGALEVYLLCLLSLANCCDIRLNIQNQNGLEVDGVPEVKTGSTWKSICAEYSQINTNSLCQELGYKGGNTSSKYSNSRNSLQVLCNASYGSLCECIPYKRQTCSILIVTCLRGITSNTAILKYLGLGGGIIIILLILVLIIIVVTFIIKIRCQTRNMYNLENGTSGVGSNLQDLPNQQMIRDTNLNSMVENTENKSLPQYIAVMNFNHFINNDNFNLFIENRHLSPSSSNIDDEETPSNSGIMEIPPELPERRYLEDNSSMSSCYTASTESIAEDSSIVLDEMSEKDGLHQENGYMHLDPKKCDSTKEEPYMSLSSTSRQINGAYEEVSNYMTLTPSTMTKETVRRARLPHDVKAKALKNSGKEGPYSECIPASKEVPKST